MPLIGTLTSGSLGAFGLAQQAQIAILKATTAISGSVPVSADWSTATVAHTLDNPNPYGTSENDQFGSAVAMSSTHAIVGTYYESDASGTMAGKAYIYDIATGALLHTLDNPNPYGTEINDRVTGNDRFGFSVAISDTYAIVGAYQEDEAGGNSSGKAYIYSLSDGSLIKTLSNRNPDASALGDLFGFSVAISDTYAIVGAWGEDWPYGGGAAYIYDISSLSSDGSVPSPTIIQNASTDSNAYFGWAVALSDNYVIVSAPNAFSSTGQAFVFNLSDGSLLYTFDNPNPDGAGSNDKFGGTASPYHSPTMLAISDNYAIVGAPHEDDASGDKSGKAYVFDLSDGSLAYTLDNPNPVGTSTEDYFGMAVDLDDDFVIVGAPYEDDAVSNLYPGKAYIYNLTDGSLVRTLDDPNAFGTTDGDRFGHSVAIYDGIAIVSASREDDGSGTSSNSSGKVYIFNAPEAAPVVAPAVSADWSNVTLAHTLDNPNPHDTSTDDFFGNAVAMSDNYTIVGAYREYDAGANSGKAYIFNSTTGALLHTLDNPNAYGTSTDDNFGSAVAISDDYAFVCTHSESNDSGKAYIFNVSDGSLAYTLDNPNLGYGTGANGDKFGYSCAISGDFVIASAVEENDINGTDSGIVYIFNVSDGSLVHTLINPNPYSTSTSDKFGYKVAISGDHAIVCARDEDDAGGSSSGKAYIYNVTTSALLHTLDNPNPYDTSRNDRFGFSCAISGDHAIVSAYAEDDANGVDSGKAYIFNVTTGALLHTLDNPNAYNTSQTDYFGYSVAINDTHAIINAAGEDGADGGNSGKAYIFDLSDGSLVSIVDNPNAYGTSAGDQFGLSVAMNNTHAVVGSIYESDWLGKAYIFSASVAAPVSSGWSVDLSNITYDNVSYTIADNLDNTPYQIVFNDDGTKMYVMGGNNDRILTYPLSTAFDLSTISALSGLFTVSSQETGPTSLAFNTDGTKMYILGYGSANIHQYTLSTAFQVTASSVSYDNVSFSVSNQELYPMNLVFNTDGTKMYVNGFNNTIYEYALTTAFDVSSASFNNASFSGATEATGLYGFRFNQDGTKMYWISNQSDAVYQYSLATAFDVSTTSYDSVSYSILSEDRETLDLVFSNDGTKMYISGSHADTVHQYSTGL